MLLFKTSLARLCIDDLPGGPPTAAVLSRVGTTDGMPFMLGADGSYDVELNRFFRELEGWGVRSEHSREAYARDLTLFCRFLFERRGGLTIWRVGPEDLRAYKRVRRRVEGPGRVSASTWNRFIAALDKWVSWAVYEGLVERDPFRRVERVVVGPHGPQVKLVNAEYEAGEGPAPVRFMAYEDYLLWRDVGLRGRLPDGGVDSRWRGRNGERNAVFADLLVGTGLRLSEAAYLLVNELPPAERPGVGELMVAAATAKRNRSRSVFISRRVLRALHAYVGIEREEIVGRCSQAGRYRASGWVGVESAGRSWVRVAGQRGRTVCGRIEARRRRRLVLLGGTGEVCGPLALWVGESGAPLGAAAWQAVFGRANQRCARLGLDIEASPHTLRHTFAVHMLGLLLRQTVLALRRDDRDGLSGRQVKRLLIGDPMRRLQLLLGHRSQETTLLYLDVLDEAQEIVLGALAEWDEHAEHAEALRRMGARVRTEAGLNGPPAVGAGDQEDGLGVLV